MLGKILLLAGMIPLGLSFVIAQFFGARHLVQGMTFSKASREILKTILDTEGIEIKEKSSWWFGANPLKEKVFRVSKKVVDSKEVRDVAFTAHTAGLALLQQVHEKSVLMRYRGVRFAAVIPMFAVVAAILARIGGRMNTTLCLGMISISVGLACLACLVHITVEREAARRALHAMEKKGGFKRLSEQEQFENALSSVAYLNALPRVFHVFLNFKKKQ